MQSIPVQQPQYLMVQQQPQQPPSPGWKMADNVYEGSASLGKIVGVFGAISSILLGLILLAIGIYLIFKKSLKIVTNATIKKADCKEVIQEVDGKRTIIQNCILDISYIAIDGKTYNVKIKSDTSDLYREGQIIKVSYEELNPSNATIHTITGRTVGLILLGISIFIIIGASFSLYLSMNYKVYQAAQGIGFAGNAIDNAIN